MTDGTAELTTPVTRRSIPRESQGPTKKPAATGEGGTPDQADPTAEVVHRLDDLIGSGKGSEDGREPDDVTLPKGSDSAELLSREQSEVVLAAGQIFPEAAQLAIKILATRGDVGRVMTSEAAELRQQAETVTDQGEKQTLLARAFDVEIGALEIEQSNLEINAAKINPHDTKKRQEIISRFSQLSAQIAAKREGRTAAGLSEIPNSFSPVAEAIGVDPNEARESPFGGMTRLVTRATERPERREELIERVKSLFASDEEKSEQVGNLMSKLFSDIDHSETVKKWERGGAIAAVMLLIALIMFIMQAKGADRSRQQ